MLISFGTTAVDAKRELKLSFQNVADSRCPTDTTCVWEGDAAVDFLFAIKSSEVRLKLHSNPRFDNETTAHGYKVRLIELSPYPERQDAPPLDSAYVATVRIEEAIN